MIAQKAILILTFTSNDSVLPASLLAPRLRDCFLVTHVGTDLWKVKIANLGNFNPSRIILNCVGTDSSSDWRGFITKPKFITLSNFKQHKDSATKNAEKSVINKLAIIYKLYR